jgi:hypothetical protein
MIHMATLLPFLLTTGPAEPATPADTQPQGNTFFIAGAFDSFTTDELGNVYTLSGDVLELFDKQGRSWLRNSLKTFGRISNIDAFYSLRPMVFSAEQGNLAVLDNTLSIQGSVINISRHSPQVVLAAMSVQNNFWLFDERELSLIRVDRQMRPLADTGRLDQLLGFTPKPVQMQEHDSWLYVNDPVHGMLVFDLFGTYARTLPLAGAQSFEVRGEELYFFKEGELHLYDMRSFNITRIHLPPGVQDVRDARVERGMLYLLLKDSVLVTPIPRQP